MTTKITNFVIDDSVELGGASLDTANFTTVTTGGSLMSWQPEIGFRDSGVVVGSAGYNDGFIGFGSVTVPGQALHLGDGNILIEGGGETSVQWKLSGYSSGAGPSGLITNPIFSFGRIVQAGDGDIELRCFFQADQHTERSVFEFDCKGIIASVKPASVGGGLGSHFEGFVGGDSQPKFRLNSYSNHLLAAGMRLEMGPGGSTNADVAVERSGASELGLMVGANTAHLQIAKVNTDGIGINNAKKLMLYDVDGSNYVALRAPGALSADVTYILPAIDGTAGQVLSTNGTGTLSWVDN